MIIGIDLDNTIVDYEGVFYQEALEQNLIPVDFPATKRSISLYLRETYGNERWTLLQGHVYGLCMAKARLFEGVDRFLNECRSRAMTVLIISHKTKYPAFGPPHDLHLAATTWLRDQGFFSPEGFAIPSSSVFFAETRREKVNLIKKNLCDVFIDDLPEVFEEMRFPDKSQKILFDPANEWSEWKKGVRCQSWNGISQILFP